MRKFVIGETELRTLLQSFHEMSILERDGVDSWTWYMESYKAYCAEENCTNINEIIEKKLKAYKEVVE